MNARDRLRVVLLVPGFPTAEAPCNSAVNLVACRLLSSYVDVRVVWLRAWRPGRRLRMRYTYEGIQVTALCLPQTPGFFHHNVAVFQRVGWPLIRTEVQGIDILHSVDLVGAGLAGCYWSYRSGIPHVVQVVGSDLNSLYPLLRLRRHEEFWQQYVDAALCNSRDLAEKFARQFRGVERVRVVHRGTDLELFRPAPAPPEAKADKSGVRFLFLGGFPHDPTLASPLNLKGGESVLAAWQAAEGELHAQRASLVVGGPVSDSQRVRGWREHLKFPDAVTIAGLLPPREIPSVIRAADVVLVPSLREGLPNVAVEAAASGRAVLGTRIPGVEEIVRDGLTGVLVPPDEVSALAAAMVRLSACGSQVRSMGEQARLVAEQEFDNRDFAPRVLSVYEEVRDEVRRPRS